LEQDDEDLKQLDPRWQRNAILITTNAQRLLNPAEWQTPSRTAQIA
jgi:hypothetical protein